uniref:RRM domain-containing protein n=1 Tax=Eutreptiella gymnastica TaxID=73025 RepID=A0A7S4GHE4_9EUGL|mmetsp:Transcript_97665/g.164466  ORF Transcript_97665/g.164466 Transcript_97665/m.164466 type:complete len:124 (+) Transcript_97665:38-409(+)|eukprot:CAMPEP_0174311288 /NCGR_PEP_ID=MMETSP0810-20121108/3628_1 /TAXON_ID=73025 ORGANISM="Eutreptiella gymnastica-like, Strain CCMP1594" /NCGR_SAMPLE_ID=MMETSP0810 /ASSEMBLY_ACC=CAM_ASM_000659 /LENGTH=123 /DNA_ID=CAMNT_0015419507 /DNA_START=36 /DNA_END=407 /DNA_ORIENTATION=+
MAVKQGAEKRTLYVGGLEEGVDEAILKAAFIPFGEVLDTMLPLDQLNQKNRGFAFVEFELQEDAAAAIENMNGAELYGRVLKVNLARPQSQHLGRNRKAVWETHADEILKDEGQDGDGEEGDG